MNLRQFLKIIEISTKLVSVEGFAIGALLALRAANSLDLVSLSLAFCSVIAIDSGTTAFNSFFDYWSGVDDRETNRESDKVILTEGIPGIHALFIALACCAIGIASGVMLASRTGWILLPVGALCLMVGFFYNGGPIPLSRTPFGELFAGAFLGPILILIVFFSQTAYIDYKTLLSALPSYFMVAAILSVNNLCDMEGDKRAGRKTFPIVFGPRIAYAYLLAELCLGYCTLFLAALCGLAPRYSGLLAIPAAIASFLQIRAMKRRGFSHAAKGWAMKRILSIFMWYGLGYIAGIIVELF